jgi:endoglucanase
VQAAGGSDQLGTSVDSAANAAGAGGDSGNSATAAGAAGKAGVAGMAGLGVAGSTVVQEAVIVPRPPAVSVHGQLRVEGTQLVDEQGAAVQLKGPSSMWLNWENSGYAQDPDGVRFLRDNWQASLIRAAMGVDASGAYLTNPEKAKTQVRAIVDLAIQLGIYVIIDWHDHTAEKHQAEAIAFFTEMATAYGDKPNVIYELYNEPLKVDWTTVVKPYHEAVVAAIRAVDPDNVIILGTPNWSQYVDVAAASPVAGTNLMYTLHFYSCTHTQSLRNRANAALKLGLPLFVTEWGATNADGGVTGSLCLEEAQNWHDWMNTNKISWAAWKLDDCTDLSCYFKSGTSTKGNWVTAQLNGHAPFVRDRMRE